MWFAVFKLQVFAWACIFVRFRVPSQGDVWVKEAPGWLVCPAAHGEPTAPPQAEQKQVWQTSQGTSLQQEAC